MSPGPGSGPIATDPVAQGQVCPQQWDAGSAPLPRENGLQEPFSWGAGVNLRQACALGTAALGSGDTQVPSMQA